MQVNIPNQNPAHYFIYSENIPLSLQNDYKQIMDWLVEMALGYDRFVLFAYELEDQKQFSLQQIN
ncbi:MAG: hypothetical protein ACJA1U_002753 [Bermanella sp.]